MARQISNSSGVKDPSKFYIDIQNNGNVNVYDTQEREPVDDFPNKGPYTFIGRAFFKTNIDIRGKEKHREDRSGIYLKKKQPVRVYDMFGEHVQNTTPEVLKREGFTTGAYVWALNPSGQLCRFELTSTGVGQFADLVKDANGNAPDFSFQIKENHNFGEDTRGKYFPDFKYEDLTPDDQAAETIQEAEKAVNDFLVAKGVKDPSPLASAPETPSPADPEKHTDGPKFGG